MFLNKNSGDLSSRNLLEAHTPMTAELAEEVNEGEPNEMSVNVVNFDQVRCKTAATFNNSYRPTTKGSSQNSD